MLHPRMQWHIHTYLWHEVECPLSDTVALLCTYKHGSMNRNSVLNFMFNSTVCLVFEKCIYMCACVCAAYFICLGMLCVCVYSRRYVHDVENQIKDVVIGGNVVKKCLFRCLEATLPDGRSDCREWCQGWMNTGQSTALCWWTSVKREDKLLISLSQWDLGCMYLLTGNIRCHWVWSFRGCIKFLVVNSYQSVPINFPHCVHTYYKAVPIHS